MAISIEAVYENGVLKPAEPLPLKEQEKVRSTVEQGDSPLLRAYGIMGWTGDAETIERIALDPEFLPRGTLMIFADLATGDSVFVDANTLIYHFSPHPTFGTASHAPV